MNEFIEKLIGRLEEYKTKYYVTGITNNPYEFGACNAMDSAIKIVNQLAEEYINTSTDTSSGWIPVKNRKVIAWMPLPQPYTEEQKELSTT